MCLFKDRVQEIVNVNIMQNHLIFEIYGYMRLANTSRKPRNYPHTQVGPFFVKEEVGVWTVWKLWMTKPFKCYKRQQSRAIVDDGFSCWKK